MQKITSQTNKMKPARWNLQEEIGLTFYTNHNISLLQKKATFFLLAKAEACEFLSFIVIGTFVLKATVPETTAIGPFSS